MIHGLMLAAAIEAGTPEAVDKQPSTPSFGTSGSVVLGEVIGARASTVPVPAIGGVGGFGQVSAAWLSFGTTTVGGSEVRRVAAEPSFDVFVANGVSLGGVLGGGVTSVSTEGATASTEYWHFTAMPRIGDTFDLTKEIALWPRFAAGVTLAEQPGTPLSSTLRATFDVPFVFRIARHVALQAGPHVSYANQLSGPFPVRGFSGGASAGLSIVL